MSINERIAALEDQLRTLAAQHFALQTTFLTLYPARSIPAEALDILRTNTHAVMAPMLKAGDADEEFVREAGGHVELLFDILAQAHQPPSGGATRGRG